MYLGGTSNKFLKKFDFLCPSSLSFTICHLFMVALIHDHLVMYHLCKSGDQILTILIFWPEFVFRTPFGPGNLEYREMSLENGEAGRERINSESEPPAIVASHLLKSPSLLLFPSPRNQISCPTPFIISS